MVQVVAKGGPRVADQAQLDPPMKGRENLAGPRSRHGRLFTTGRGDQIPQPGRIGRGQLHADDSRQPPAVLFGRERDVVDQAEMVLVVSEDLKGAILTRFDLRRSAQFTPIKICWTTRSSVPDEVSGSRRQPGGIGTGPGRFTVSEIDIPVTLLDTLVLSFDRANTGAEVVGRFEWLTGDETPLEQGRIMDFAGDVNDDGLLAVDLALVAQWLQTKSIAGFSVEYGSGEPLELITVTFSSEKLKPKSRLLEVALPRGKTFSRAPRAVVRDLLKEAK